VVVSYYYPRARCRFDIIPATAPSEFILVEFSALGISAFPNEAFLSITVEGQAGPRFRYTGLENIPFVLGRRNISLLFESSWLGQGDGFKATYLIIDRRAVPTTSPKPTPLPSRSPSPSSSPLPFGGTEGTACNSVFTEASGEIAVTRFFWNARCPFFIRPVLLPNEAIVFRVTEFYTATENGVLEISLDGRSLPDYRLYGQIHDFPPLYANSNINLWFASNFLQGKGFRASYQVINRSAVPTPSLSPSVSVTPRPTPVPSGRALGTRCGSKLGGVSGEIVVSKYFSSARCRFDIIPWVLDNEFVLLEFSLFDTTANVDFLTITVDDEPSPRFRYSGILKNIPFIIANWTISLLFEASPFSDRPPLDAGGIRASYLVIDRRTVPSASPSVSFSSSPSPSVSTTASFSTSPSGSALASRSGSVSFSSSPSPFVSTTASFSPSPSGSALASRSGSVSFSSSPSPFVSTTASFSPFSLGSGSASPPRSVSVSPLSSQTGLPSGYPSASAEPSWSSNPSPTSSAPVSDQPSSPSASPEVLASPFSTTPNAESPSGMPAAAPVTGSGDSLFPQILGTEISSVLCFTLAVVACMMF
jgi:hypothetical protein